jgi:hypothetical protein
MAGCLQPKFLAGKRLLLLAEYKGTSLVNQFKTFCDNLVVLLSTIKFSKDNTHPKLRNLGPTTAEEQNYTCSRYQK